MSCTDTCTSLSEGVVCPRKAEGWRTVHSTAGGTHYMEQAPGNTGAVQPCSLMERSGLKTAGRCYFCNFHPCNYMEYNKEDYLDSSLTLFSHYSSSSRDGGGSEAILGGCAFFMVMSYDVLICQIKYMS